MNKRCIVGPMRAAFNGWCICSVAAAGRCTSKICTAVVAAFGVKTLYAYDTAAPEEEGGCTTECAVWFPATPEQIAAAKLRGREETELP
jgi:hypothetical protein